MNLLVIILIFTIDIFYHIGVVYLLLTIVFDARNLTGMAIVYLCNTLLNIIRALVRFVSEIFCFNGIIAARFIEVQFCTNTRILICKIY